MPIRTHYALTAGITIAALLLGGGTRHGLPSDVILQLLAIPLAISCLIHARASATHKIPGSVSLWCTALVAVPLFQLVPLPPSLWTHLPGHDVVRQSIEATGQNLPWLSISVAPQSTWISLASLLPPLAILIGTVQLTNRERRSLSVVILATGLLSVFLGLLQVAQGPQSWLRFYEFTNTTEAVGFFANRNHFATFLLSLMMLAAVWTMNSTQPQAGETDPPIWSNTNVLVALTGFTVMAVLIAGQVMARSRAGLALTIVALIFVLLLVGGQGRKADTRLGSKILIGSIVFVAILSVQFAIYRVFERFSSDPLSDARLAFARNTLAAAKSFLPFGSGMGSFVKIYGAYEKPQDVVAGTYANHAHSDALQIVLEAGIAGIILIAIAALWHARRTAAVWRTSATGDYELDLNLTRACSLIIILVAAHSVVDYPLRTAAMSAVLAFAAGQMLAVTLKPRTAHASPAHETLEEAVRQALRSTSARTSSHAKSPRSGPAGNPADMRAAPPRLPLPSEAKNPVAGGRWGGDQQWPAAWTGTPSPEKSGSKQPGGPPPGDENEKDKP